MIKKKHKKTINIVKIPIPLGYQDLEKYTS